MHVQMHTHTNTDTCIFCHFPETKLTIQVPADHSFQRKTNILTKMKETWRNALNCQNIQFHNKTRVLLIFFFPLKFSYKINSLGEPWMIQGQLTTCNLKISLATITVHSVLSTGSANALSSGWVHLGIWVCASNLEGKTCVTIPAALSL